MGSKLDNIINDMNTNLSPEESSMVDSIINDLNSGGKNNMYGGGGGGPNIPPHLTPEEKEMFMKQHAHQQQMNQQQQQQMNQQQMNQQQQQQQQMKQQQQQQQQQMQQQQMQQQQMQQQIQMKKQMEEEIKQKMKKELEEENKQNEGILDKLKMFMMNNKETLLVIILSLLFNLESVHEGLKIKSLPFFYDIETDTSTFMFSLFKTTIISGLFCLLLYISK